MNYDEIFKIYSSINKNKTSQVPIKSRENAYVMFCTE